MVLVVIGRARLKFVVSWADIADGAQTSAKP
jgi:hypothetical protein